MVSTLQGQNVVVTGKVEGETRVSANAKLAAAGAFVQSSVTQTTSLVIIAFPGWHSSKVEKAQANGIPIITWDDAMTIARNGGSSATVAATPPPPPPQPVAPEATRNKPIQPQPGYRQIDPMLCLKADGLPSGDDWLYEIKWDGYRAIAHVDGQGGVQLASRKGLDFSRFTLIKAELEQLPVQCILDGEICWLDDDGHSHFEELAGGASPERIKYLVFDVLEAEGIDLRKQPLSDRQQAIEWILEGRVRVTPSLVWPAEEAEGLLAYAAEQGLEGIVAKKATSPYREGHRGKTWLKIKLRLEQEFVVVGWTRGKGNRAGTAGSLLLAVNDGTKRKPKWVYCGSAGSGGTYDDYAAIVDQLADAPTSPLDDGTKFTAAELRETTWVKPTLVVQVKFQRWTKDGRLIHPAVQGVREDKTPLEVRRET